MKIESFDIVACSFPTTDVFTSKRSRWLMNEVLTAACFVLLQPMLNVDHRQFSWQKARQFPATSNSSLEWKDHSCNASPYLVGLHVYSLPYQLIIVQKCTSFSCSINFCMCLQFSDAMNKGIINLFVSGELVIVPSNFSNTGFFNKLSSSGHYHRLHKHQFYSSSASSSVNISSI